MIGSALLAFVMVTFSNIAEGGQPVQDGVMLYGRLAISDPSAPPKICTVREGRCTFKFEDAWHESGAMWVWRFGQPERSATAAMYTTLTVGPLTPPRRRIVGRGGQ